LPDFRQLLQGSNPNPEGVVLCHAWWGENLARFGSAQDLFIKTVWESSQLPMDWPARLNQARAVIVPSDFAARVFRKSGVRVPVEVAYEGVDPDVYPYVERSKRREFTTLIVGVLAPRKNFRHAVRAWQLAFADDPDARLILKARFQIDRFVSDDPRIQVIDDNEATRGILRWYQQADVLLALGNEGFGLPVIEAMATGLPVVALNAEAQADVIVSTSDATSEGVVLPVKVASWEQVSSPAFGSAGVRALPDVEDAARQLRWVAGHRDEALEMGRRASTWAHTHRNVWNLGPATLAVIEKYARTPRPLRRTYAVWAPGGDGSEQIAYYVRNFARTLFQARIYESPPTIGQTSPMAVAWRSPVLHIHYAPGLILDDELAKHIQAAKHQGMAVAVTEHGIREDSSEQAHAWEQKADVLIAPNPAIADRLRTRWPYKRIEVIPLGMPRYRPSQRRHAGRTIAVIGGADSLSALDEIAQSMDAQLLVVTPDSHGEGRPYRNSIDRAGRAPGRNGKDVIVSGDREAYAALNDDGEEFAQWLSEKADAVVCLNHAAEEKRGMAGYLEHLAVASGAPVVAAQEVGAGLCFDESRPIYRPDDLSTGLREVLENPARRAQLADAARKFCEEASWERIGALHLALWRTLIP
jgi:glycosyltransferase involved in cell wall biosynthesis